MDDTDKQHQAKPLHAPSQTVPEHFVDGVAHIGLSGGVVRIDFAHLASASATEPGSQRLERNVRLVASLEGFIATYQTMQRMVERLASQGKLALAPGPRLRDNPKAAE
jgi:hypothetical protein